jgi:uncharacterized protein with NRDE domain
MLVQVAPDFPLVVAANRDEQFERPAVPMTVLSAGPPRILGGRDELAGGTWLAVNSAGVVAGLTNRPLAGQRDPTKASRGELPLALASHRTAAAAVDAFVSQFRPADYNPAWLLVGDRDTAFGIDMTGDDEPAVHPLEPGVHILENAPVGADTPKVAHVRNLVGSLGELDGEALGARLRLVLSDHQVPAGHVPANGEIPPQVKAACVHTERYGTRWSSVTMVPRDPDRPPSVRYSDGPPCMTTPVDAAPLWRAMS